MKTVNLAINPGTTLPGELLPTRYPGIVFSTVTDAYLWCYTERRNLIALSRQAARLGGRAADLIADIALTTTESGEGPHTPDLTAAMTSVLDSAVRTGNLVAQQRLRIALGTGLALTCMRHRLARDHLVRACAEGPPPSLRLAGTAAVAHLSICWLDDEADTVAQHYRECLGYAERAGDPLLEIATHYFAGYGFLWTDDAEQAHAAGGRAMAAAERRGMLHFQAGALSLLGSTVFDTGRGSRADAVRMCVEGVQLARDSGSRTIGGWTLMLLARAHLLAGDHAAAETTAREAIISSEWAGRGVQARSLVFLASALRATGRNHEAQFAFQQAGEVIEQDGIALSPWELGLLADG
ncbi:hypothetical protein [Nocardia heshunensis]